MALVAGRRGDGDQGGAYAERIVARAPADGGARRGWPWPTPRPCPRWASPRTTPSSSRAVSARAAGPSSTPGRRASGRWRSRSPAVGARAIATTSAGKVAAVEALGADVVVDYGSADFLEAVAAATGGRGVDVVLDVVGGDYLDRNVRSLRVGGTIVQVGVMGGGRTQIDLGALLPRRAHLVGTVLRARPLEEKAAASQRFAAEVVPAIEAGAVRPVIDRRYPITEIAEAHRYLETNQSIGKVVIDVLSAL
ncbi:MAG: zinc-binding dehydrogenase [Acidimicrobiales bacterium]